MAIGSFGRYGKDKSMFNNLKSKIEFEYKVFIELLKALSRPEIVSRSFEIAYKEALYRRLIDSINNDVLTQDKSLYISMMEAENSLDQLYLSAKTKGALVLNGGDIPDKEWDIIINSVMF